MDRSGELAFAVSVAGGVVEAVGRGAAPGDGTADGELLRAVLDHGAVGADSLDEVRDRLGRGARGAPARPDLVEAMADLADPLVEAAAAGREWPEAPARFRRGPGELDDVALEVFTTVALRKGLTARIARDRETAAAWWGVAEAAGHPAAARLLRTVRPRPPRPRWVRALAWTVVPVLVAGLAGWLVVRSIGPDEHDIPASVGGFDEACEGGVFPDAPAHAGAGPHPTAVLAAPALENPYLRVEDKVWNPAAVVEDDGALSPAWNPDDPRRVQAVACADFTAYEDSSIKDCTYQDFSRPGSLSRQGRPIPMHRGRYVITVYEARSHRELRRAEVTGLGAECPGSVLASILRLYSQLTAAQYVEAIGGVVDG